jgi:hypothetical protein
MTTKEFFDEIYLKLLDENISLDDFKKYSNIISKKHWENFGMSKAWLEFHKYFKAITSTKDKDVLLYLTMMAKDLSKFYDS